MKKLFPLILLLILLIACDQSGPAEGEPEPDLSPPVISWLEPTAREWVSGVDTLSVEAKDEASGMAYLVFYANAVRLGPAAAADDGSYSLTWDTAEHEDGEVTLRAYAYDLEGNYETASRLVTIINTVDGAPVPDTDPNPPPVADPLPEPEPDPDPLPTPTPVPEGWQHRDIGSVGSAGSYSRDEEAATFSVKGSGTDIWYYTDQFFFVYRALTGDGALSVRVDALTNTHEWSKAGVMIRRDLTPDSPYAAVFATSQHGPRFQIRLEQGRLTGGGPGNAVARWVKIEREGVNIYSYDSADGVTWHLLGISELPLEQTVYLGLAVTSHDNTKIAQADFSDVILREGPPPVEPAPSTFSLDLYNTTEPEGTVTLQVSKPEGAETANMLVSAFDADFPTEGELYVNGNGPLLLFGDLGIAENDGKTVLLTLPTPADWWQDGANELRFVRLDTLGYSVEGGEVSFSSPAE